MKEEKGNEVAKGKRLRASTIVLVLLLTIMAVPLLSQMRLANALGYRTRADADHFAQLQTIRSVSDLAVLQFCRDVQSFTLVHDNSTDWIGVTGPGVYNEALNQIQSSVLKPGERSWTCTQLNDLISAMGISEPSAIAVMQEAMEGSESNLDLQLVTDIDFDWVTAGNSVGRKEATISLEPLDILVRVKVGSKTYEYPYKVEGLSLEMVTESDSNSSVFSIGGTPCLERD